MLSLKTALFGLISAATVAAAPAGAASFEVWNGSAWSASGTTHLVGPVDFSYLSQFPCTADFTVTVNNGVATVSQAQFGGSQLCAAISAQLLPWSMLASPTPYAGANPPFAGAPMLTPQLHEVSLTGVRIRLPAPLNANCPATPSTGGTLVGVLDSTTQLSAPVANRFVFNTTLAPCSIRTRANPTMTANPALRIVP
ncbi:hypothetical protein [Pseudomonas sp. CGJS7]|uniref:hypothetical protein n=1 Tax=Pseudomonas sp. CGJS7 TaxID=3109348 RepID=UPI00300A16E8